MTKAGPRVRSWTERIRDLPQMMVVTPSQIRLRTLVLWRWAAVLGQAATLLFVGEGLGFEIPFWSTGACVLALAWLNIILALMLPMARLLNEAEVVAHLTFDLLQLTTLLYFTGGLLNPFSLLFMVPVGLAATSLSARAALVVAALAFGAATWLLFNNQPLPGLEPGFEPNLLTTPVYAVGEWFATVVGLALLAVMAYRLSAEARGMNAALAATQRALETEQRLSEVGGLAAAAAHELGTPLATIALVAKELARDLAPDSPMAGDVRLLIDQAQRCRDILAKLSRQPAGQGSAGVIDHVALPLLAAEIARPHEGFGIRITLDAQSAENALTPILRRSGELVHGLGNFVENAIDFATSEVRIEMRWSTRDMWLRVIDDGPGFPPNILDRLGEPYLTTRQPKNAGPKTGAPSPQDLHDRDIGMGLGVFIAKTLLERTGAKITFANRGGSGAIVALHWRRPAPIEAPADGTLDAMGPG